MLLLLYYYLDFEKYGLVRPVKLRIDLARRHLIGSKLTILHLTYENKFISVGKTEQERYLAITKSELKNYLLETVTANKKIYLIIAYTKKYLQSDWLRGVQY